jgi:sulfate/thiosulfate transport system substrate-binding protein
MPRIILAGLVATVALAAAACGGTSEETAEAGGGERLTLVAYTTPREVYEVLIPAFAKTQQGAGSSFDQSYGSSGEQSRAVEGGLPADIVALSLEPDVTRLVEAGLVAEDWSEDAHDGMVSRSVVALAVRKGNPKGIEGWDDLLRDDVEVITPNPFTSGGARWNVMAAYGAQLEQGKSEEQAVDYLRRLFANVSVQDKSARESLQTFTGGKGDVLIAYENEAITAQQKGEELDYVIPDETILIENPIAVLEGAPAQARAFVDFLRTKESQEVFAEKGYRSVLDELVDEERYPAPETLFTIADLGGWSEVQESFFDREEGIMADIQREVGAALE